MSMGSIAMRRLNDYVSTLSYKKQNKTKGKVLLRVEMKKWGSKNKKSFVNCVGDQ